ncbi:MAG: acyltransferase family protein, partial [Planctomycetota bacterium]
DANLWGLSHLWFLPYLMTYVVGLGLLDLWACRHEKRLSNWLRCNTWSISAIWLTSVGLIAIAPQIVWGFQHAFLPVPTKWAYCGLFFLLGAMLQSTNGMWNDISAVASRMFPIAIMMLLATVAMGQHATDLVGMDVDADSQRNGTWSLSVMPMTAIVLALMTPTTAALTTVVVLGWTNRAIRQPGRISASLSAASLTIYLAHHPVVAATQIMLKTAVPMWPPLVKVTLVVVTGVGLPWLMHVMHAARAARRDDDVGQAPRTITLPKPDIAKAA